LGEDFDYVSLLGEERQAELRAALTPERLRAAERQLALAVIDDIWSDYLASIAELRGGIHWVSWGGRDPLHSFLTAAVGMYEEVHERLREEIVEAFETAELRDGDIHFANHQRFERGATWTYLTTDQPFGTLTERFLQGICRKIRKRELFG
jgi:preprotein translocase subunit SecA